MRYKYRTVKMRKMTDDKHVVQACFALSYQYYERIVFWGALHGFGA